MAAARRHRLADRDAPPRAGSLFRRSSRLVRRHNEDACVGAYLAGLGRLLAAVARALEGDSRLHVRRDRLPLLHASEQHLHRGLVRG